MNPRSRRLLPPTSSECAAALDRTEAYVRVQPLKSIAIAASVGVLVGMLFLRR